MFGSDFRYISGSVFKRLSKKFKEYPITKVNCTVFESFEDAYHWLELEHTGAANGIGTNAWNAQQVDRFKRMGSAGASPGLQLLDFLKKSDAFDDDLKVQLNDVNISTLNRLLGDKTVKEFFGIKIENKKLKSDLHPDEIAKAFRPVITDILGGLTSRDIDTKIERSKYLKERYDASYLPNKQNILDESWVLDAEKILTSDAESTKNSDNKNNPKPAKPTPLSTDRLSLIPAKTNLQIPETRINKIYYELRKLNVNEYENAVSVLFRVFIELSIDSFIDKYSLIGDVSIRRNASLFDKTKYVINYFKSQGIMNENDLKPVNTAISNQHNIMSINTFNAYVHNSNFIPSPLELKISWDRLETFVQRIWQMLHSDQNTRPS